MGKKNGENVWVGVSVFDFTECLLRIENIVLIYFFNITYVEAFIHHELY